MSRGAWERLPPKMSNGWLRRYAAMVTGADTGAVLKTPEV